jgi:hypothetical protein
LETQLLVSEQLGYAGRNAIDPLLERSEEIGKMLRAMQKSLRAKL